jgi:molecular chaperone DnaK
VYKRQAQDKATGRSQHITITASSGLSEAEIERMKREADQHADEDRKRKELIEARNHADNMVYTAEKTLKDLGDKVPADLKAQVEEGVTKLKGVQGSEDLDTIRRATEDLGQTVQKVGAAAYQQTPPGPGEPGAAEPGPEAGGGSGGQGGEDVVDGEFKSV